MPDLIQAGLPVPVVQFQDHRIPFLRDGLQHNASRVHVPGKIAQDGRFIL
jgi:hypothetical protein